MIRHDDKHQNKRSQLSWFRLASLALFLIAVVNNKTTFDGRQTPPLPAKDGEPPPPSAAPQRVVGTTTTSSAPATPLLMMMNASLDFITLKGRLTFGYSGMWWMSREQFMQINVKEIDYLEAATFVPFQGWFGLDRVLLTRDWLDCSVEHLSRYSKMIRNLDVKSFHRKIAILQRYLSRSRTSSDSSSSSSSVASSTLAIVSFYVRPGPMTIDDLAPPNGTTIKIPFRGAVFDLYALAATLLSLWKAGIPRIVVVGNVRPTPPQVTLAFQLVYHAIATTGTTMTQSSPSSSSPPPPSSNETTDETTGQPPPPPLPLFSLHYVLAHNIQPIVKKGSSHTTILPRHAIDNLQQAMLGNLTNAYELLGNDPSRWKYVYFSEYDLMLHTRATALPALAERMQAGFAIAAHRFQPLPHKVDYPNHHWPGQLVPSLGTLGTFYDLNAETDACCYIGDYQPGRANLPTNSSCRPVEWYGCGLRHDLPAHSEVVQEYYQRLSQYPMIRLVDGLLVPLVNEHARVCLPSRRGTCSHMIP